MKEIRMDEGTLNLEILIQVTLNPKGEQGAAEGGYEASIEKIAIKQLFELRI